MYSRRIIIKKAILHVLSIYKYWQELEEDKSLIITYLLRELSFVYIFREIGDFSRFISCFFIVLRKSDKDIIDLVSLLSTLFHNSGPLFKI